MIRFIKGLVSVQTALVIADSEGRNSVFMAEQGLQVTAMDSSQVGIAKAKKLADTHSVEVDFQHVDLREWDPFPPRQYQSIGA